ncbi:hypothetical protein cyc_07488 [Cyclospora cayetanensis]|uniref:Uncharacterized protein n=1 Tax=Cyclospora cayetanensis TaxID=88456 RepID=A0A1D3CVU2_9EIME|nr:hypothetical protein cyc_07488 [Cyclospora cayetanensis]
MVNDAVSHRTSTSVWPSKGGDRAASLQNNTLRRLMCSYRGVVILLLLTSVLLDTTFGGDTGRRSRLEGRQLKVSDHQEKHSLFRRKHNYFPGIGNKKVPMASLPFTEHQSVDRRICDTRLAPLLEIHILAPISGAHASYSALAFMSLILEMLVYFQENHFLNRVMETILKLDESGYYQYGLEEKNVIFLVEISVSRIGITWPEDFYVREVIKKLGHNFLAAKEASREFSPGHGDPWYSMFTIDKHDLTLEGTYFTVKLSALPTEAD